MKYSSSALTPFTAAFGLAGWPEVERFGEALEVGLSQWGRLLGVRIHVWCRMVASGSWEMSGEEAGDCPGCVSGDG